MTRTTKVLFVLIVAGAFGYWLDKYADVSTGVAVALAVVLGFVGLVYVS